ncbi:MAG: SCF ubiquitin ligase complex subunit [Piccolia ochrophora]|nr:MAG: SCF ubiquitin ligase complex subunit [Piccolia ochrophora]
MDRSRVPHRVFSNPTSESSSASSPERAEYDDTDFFTAQANDSQSSLGVTTLREMTVSPSRERERLLSPLSRLPAELLIAIFARLSSTSDLRNCMLVSKTWAKYSVDLLWHRPLCNTWENLRGVIHSVRKSNPYFAYYDLVKRLNLSSLAKDVSDGTIVPLADCKRVERLTLTNCTKLTDSGVMALINGNRSLLALDISGLESVSDHTLLTVAKNCGRLQGLNITGCRQVTDRSLTDVAENCRSIKRLKLNDCSQVTDLSVVAFANKCRQMLEIDLHECKEIKDVSVTSLLAKGSHLRELRLAHCIQITDDAFLALPHDQVFESLRILDLTACEYLSDNAVVKIVNAAPRLRNLVLAKCKKVTDRAVMAITKLGKNLHYVHLGHCASISDAAVIELVKTCNRIRYIDLACCHRLTDQSIMQLATLPKLRRIGLVKCQAITDRSILALARARVGSNGLLGTSSLERVHLSYCVQITLQGIHALLINCPRLTHLSLTGVQAFLREDLIVYCREAPPEFTDHQRDVFCVFSGAGVKDLRDHLNHDSELRENLSRGITSNFPQGTEDGFMYDDGDDATGEGEEDDQHVAGLMGATAINAGDPPGSDDVDEEFGEESEVGAE